MPEGHTIHREARLQTALLAGHVLQADSPQGRFAEGAAELDGRRLEHIDAYGKHLLYRFEQRWLHVHLGLWGSFTLGAGEPPAPRGAIRLRLVHAAGWLTLSGPAACELLDDDGRRRLLARIGPDPLRASARPAAVIARITTSTAPVGVLLMDQSVVAGIGNVYRAELAFRAGIAPFTPGRAVGAQTVRALWRDARLLLREGERTGRIVTTRPADRPHPGGAVRSGERTYVYGRAGRPCFICATEIRALPMAGRTVYFCPTCQPAAMPSSARIPGIRSRSLK